MCTLHNAIPFSSVSLSARVTFTTSRAGYPCSDLGLHPAGSCAKGNMQHAQVRVTYPEYVQIHFLMASGCLLLYKASGFAQKGVRVRFRQHTHTSCKCPSPSACRLRRVDMSGIGAIWLCPEVCACLLQWAVFGEVTQSSQTMVPKSSESGSESAVQPYPWKCSGNQYRRPHCSSH